MKSLIVALYNGVYLKADAISSSLDLKVRAFDKMASPDTCFDIKIYTYSTDYYDPRIKIVRNVNDVIFDKFFQEADVHIFEFGIYYDFFNSILITPQNSVAMAVYHSITPPELSANKSDTECLLRSFQQKSNLQEADHIFCDSQYNMNDLVEYGIDSEKLSVVPLAVSLVPGPTTVVVNDNPDIVNFLYVGRIVRSKGVIELLQALSAMMENGLNNIKLTLVGNQRISDEGYLRDVYQFIKDHSLGKFIFFAGEVEDEELSKHYSAADALVIPSHHEGFCVPVLEAFAHGCYVIGYDSGNLPFIIGGLGWLVPTGNVDSLSEAMADYARRKTVARREGTTPILPTASGEMAEVDYLECIAEHAAGFSIDTFEELFLREFFQRCLPV